MKKTITNLLEETANQLQSNNSYFGTEVVAALDNFLNDTTTGARGLPRDTEVELFANELLAEAEGGQVKTETLRLLSRLFTYVVEEREKVSV